MGADINLKMGATTTALTIAVRNTKLDGTEAVRILLSKGADPTQLAAAGIDEKDDEFAEQLNVTMRHWLAVARKVGIQSEKTKEHLKKLQFSTGTRLSEGHTCSQIALGCYRMLALSRIVR